MLPRIRLKIRLMKARPNLYLMKKSDDSKILYKFLDFQLLVRPVRPNPAILPARISTLSKASLARFKQTRVELKSSHFPPDQNHYE